ncbi:MAG: glycogen/starch synthase [Patescibacteria group bacterium]
MEEYVKPDFLFEVSWEVANKVGGIHTVITSKAREMVNFYGAGYFMIGPYFENKLFGQFEPQPVPAYLQKAFADAEKDGVIVHFGKWLIDGEPSLMLIEFKGMMPYVNEIKQELWRLHGVDSLGSGFDFDEPVAWGYAVGKLLKSIAGEMPTKKILAHFHEWLAASALVYIKKEKLDIASVFTTHATTLGRSLASRGVDFYSNFASIDPEKEARANFVQHKHQLERAAVAIVDIFTTVSQITSLEAKHFLGKEADVILPNGLDIEKFPTIEEINRKHGIQRNRIRKFLMYYFFPYYSFDVSQTVIMFIGARYEFHNKGIDVYIKALAELNRRLIASGSKKTVVSIFWVPTEVLGINEKLTRSREVFNDIQNSLEEVEEDVEDAILYSLIAQEDVKISELFDEGMILSLKQKIRELRTNDPLPPLATHNIINPHDQILRAFHEEGLTNKEEDKVKVIFYPIYSRGSDGVLDLEYYESIQGSHLGVFPSFYEPWGYTPLESAALGVASVTTDLSGFGMFFKEKLAGKKNPGVYIIERLGKSDDDIVRALADELDRYVAYSRRERVENKIAAYKLAEQADWSMFVKHYFTAHTRALAKRMPQQ